MFSIGHRLFIVAVMAACSVPSQAQDGTVRGPDGTVVAVAGGLVDPAPVKQNLRGPVSVALERKSVQTLADGTHITHVSREIYMRDSKGRVRTETEIGPFPGTEVQSHSVLVNDTVAGVTYSWQTGVPGGRKVYTMRQRPVPVANPAARSGSNPLMRTLPDSAAQAKTSAGSLGSGSEAVGTTSARSLVALPAPPPPPGPPSTAVNLTGTQQNPPLRQQTTRDALGQRIVGGLTCMAQRTTTVYPVDYFGNDRPITTMDETCLSQDAGRVIQETREDPRTGVQTVTLISGSLQEPDASLFQPPPDYTERKPVNLGQPPR